MFHQNEKKLFSCNKRHSLIHSLIQSLQFTSGSYGDDDEDNDDDAAANVDDFCDICLLLQLMLVECVVFTT